MSIHNSFKYVSAIQTLANNDTHLIISQEYLYYKDVDYTLQKKNYFARENNKLIH